jgi:uncharacterized protein involved in exopolysaccharide biosynthesis
MNPLAARVIFCVGLCLLAACAALPEAIPVETPHVAVAPAPQPSVAQQLAAATRDRIEAMHLYAPRHPDVAKAQATEATLRSYAQSLSESESVRSEIVTAMSNELTAALARRAATATRYGPTHPEMVVAEALVRELTVALNLEVRRQS